MMAIFAWFLRFVRYLRRCQSEFHGSRGAGARGGCVRAAGGREVECSRSEVKCRALVASKKSQLKKGGERDWS